MSETSPMATETVIHLSVERIEAGMAHVLDAPTDNGTLALVLRRPAEDQREVLDVAELHPDVGVVGDNWIERGSRRTDDGASHPDMQLNIMSVRFAELLAGSRERVALAGDQLYVDFDLTEANLPPWTKLAIGTAVVEITDQPHRGCAKFAARFGAAARRYANHPDRAHLHLRGVNARVAQPGQIRPGDTITKL